MELSYLQIAGLFLTGFFAGVFRKKIRIQLKRVIKWAEETKAREDAKKVKNNESTGVTDSK